MAGAVARAEDAMAGVRLVKVVSAPAALKVDEESIDPADFWLTAVSSCADRIHKTDSRLKRFLAGVWSSFAHSLCFLFASFFYFDPDSHGKSWSV